MSLREDLDGLPDGALVPVGWIRERLTGAPDSDRPTGDLTTEDVAEILDRSPQRVSEYAREGHLRGYKHGRQWKFTRSAVEAFLDDLRNGDGTGERTRGNRSGARLGDWREEREGVR